ncbi:hypothetical protein PROFUN_16835 [Planoprotostelium fungivorum]|uniref:Uncharacterized protein n=1 Tax=Planoprotostelium fungivorum TaxID=1890364 RepID=A0A2P6MNB5_9EUKA|nr:hypothetical protein PROFUN_16835 [Planoprotostelium fungivorum]
MPKTALEKKWALNALTSVQEFWRESVIACRVGPEDYWRKAYEDYDEAPPNCFGVWLNKKVHESYVQFWNYTKNRQMVGNSQFWMQTQQCLGACIEIKERKDATKQIGLFDTDDNSSINLDPIYNSVLDFKKHTILGLKDISTEKSEPTKVEDSAMERFFIKKLYEPTKVEDSAMERFFIKKLYGINHRLIDDISCVFNATDIAIYEIQQGCNINLASMHLNNGILVIPYGGVDVSLRFTPKSPIYKEFTYNINNNDILHIGCVGCKRFTITPQPGQFFVAM